MQFRDLENRDIPQLIEWLKQFNDSVDYPGKAPIDSETAELFFSRFIGNEGNAAIVAEENNKPIATLGFTVMPHPWSGKTIIFKAFWYSVKPGAGIAILRYLINMCKGKDIHHIVAGSMLPNSHKILQRFGFKPTETNYILGL